jgi:hypothetical protein
MKVCLLPKIENIRDRFKIIYDVIQKIHKIDLCCDCHIQCSSDGVWCCDDEANCLRTENKIKFNVITMQEAKTGEKGNHIKEMEDFVEHENKLEYKIHSSSGITLEDIEEQRLKGHQDYGNGFSSPFYINNKPCTLLILNEGVDIDDETFDLLAMECQK